MPTTASPTIHSPANVAFEYASSPALSSDASIESRIDETSGVIRRVKIAGLDSRNTGRTLGLEYHEYGDAIEQTYSYTPEALQDAIPLYEGASVYSNHHPFTVDPETGKRRISMGERDNDDLVGWIENVTFEADGLYGDLNYIKSHPISTRLLEIAKRRPDKLALSHEVLFGPPEVRNGRVYLTKIAKVDSVALTGAIPGTTNGLFESKAPESTPAAQSDTDNSETPNMSIKKKVKVILESVPSTTWGADILLEMMDDNPELGDMSVEMDSPDMSADEQIKAAMRTAVVAAFDDPKLDTPATLAKIKDILAAQEKVLGGNAADDLDIASEVDDGGEGDETKEEKEEEKPIEPAAEMGGPGKEEEPDAAAHESKSVALSNREAILLECVGTLNEIGVPATAPVLEAMATLPTPEKRKAFARAIKPNLAPAARSQSPASLGGSKGNSSTQPAMEVAEQFKDPGSFAQALRGVGI